MDGYRAPKYEMVELAAGVYAFVQEGGGAFCSNSGVIVGRNYVTLFDSQTNMHQTEHLMEGIRSVTDKPVRVILNSHWHTDHTWTNGMFKGAVAICSRATRKAMEEIGDREQDGFREAVNPVMCNFDGAETVLQDITFEGKISLYDGVHEMEFVDLGACHSVSDCILWLPKERILFGADLVGAECGPCNHPVANLWSGSYHAPITYNELLRYPADIFVPGHGEEMFTRERLTYAVNSRTEFLNICRAEYYRLYLTGITAEQAVEAFDYSKLAKWTEGRDAGKLRGTMNALAMRSWSEFSGEGDAAEIDIEQVFGNLMCGGKRLNLGRHYQKK